MPDVPAIDTKKISSFDEVADFGDAAKIVVDEVADFSPSTTTESFNEVADFGNAEPVVRKPPDLSKVDWSTLKKANDNVFSDPVTQQMIKDHPQGQTALDTVKAEWGTAKLYNLPLETVQGNLDRVSQSLWPGQPKDPPNVWKRIENTLTAAELNRERAKIGGRTALGTSTPEDLKRLEEIKTIMPSTEEQIKAIPNAFINFAYGMLVGIPNNIVDSLKGPAQSKSDSIAKDVSARVGASLSSMVVAPWKVPQALTEGPVGQVTKGMVEDSIGEAYLGMTDNGVDPKIAKGVAIGLGVVNTAMMIVPVLRGMTAGVGLAEKIAQKAILASILKGTAVRGALAIGEQALYGYGFSTVNTVVPEIAAALTNAVKGGEIQLKDAQEVLTQIGVEGSLSTLVGSTIAAGSIGLGLFKTIRGGALDLAVKEQVRKVEEIEAKSKIAEIKPVEPGIEKTKPYVPPAPGEQKIGDIIAMTDNEAIALDKSIQSAESSADYIQTKDMPAKEAVTIAIDEMKAKLEAKQLTTKYINDISKVDVTQMRPEYAEPVKAIMDRFTDEHFRSDTKVKLNDLKTQLETNPEIDLPKSILEKIGELDKIPYKDLSVDDVKTIRDTIIYYAKLQRESHQITIRNQKVDTAFAVEAVANELPVPKEKPPSGKAGVYGIKEKIQEGFQKLIETVGTRLDQADLVAEKIGPTFKQVVIDPVMDGYKARDGYKNTFDSEFQAKTTSLKETVGDVRKWLSETETITLSDGEMLDLTRAEKLSLYMHSLNPENRKHVLEGGFGFRFRGRVLKDRSFRISEEELTRISDSVRTNPNEKLYTDSASSLLKRTGQDQATVYLDLNDIPLPLQDNYYHIDTMPKGRGIDAEKQVSIEQAKSNIVRIGQSKGHLIERTESNIPIYLNPITHDLAVSRDHAAAYVNLEKPLKNASRLLYYPGQKAKDRVTARPSLKDLLEERTNKATWKVMEKVLKDVAGQSDPIGDFEMGSLKVRNKMATAIMGFPNVFIPAKQPAAFMRYSVYVKPDYLLKGLYDSIMHPKTTELALQENSLLYANRTSTGRSREVSDVLKAGQLGSELGGPRVISKKLMAPIGWADTRGSVRPGMRGAVLQALDEMKDGVKTGKLSEELMKATGITPEKLTIMTPEEKISAAYKFAEYATEMTQTSGNPLLQSDFQRGTTFQKMFTLFSSEGSTSMNMRRRAFFEAKKANTPVMWARFAQVMAISLIAEPLAETAVDRARKEFMGQEQVPLGKDILAHTTRGLVGGIPIARDVVQAAVNKVLLNWNYQNQGLTPIDNLANTMTNVIMLSLDPKTYKSWTKAQKYAESIADLAGLISGLPITPAIRFVKGAKNLIQKAVEK
jgi:hypothetical protein